MPGELVGDVGVTWNSANGLYSVNGYVRNVSNNIYKTIVVPNSEGGADNMTPSNPRVFGMVLSGKF